MRKQHQQVNENVKKSFVATSPKNKQIIDPEQSQQIEAETESLTQSEEKEMGDQVISPDGEPELKKEPEPLF